MEADNDLVARAAAGDEAAFTTLVERHRDRVFRLAVSILGQAFVGEAEEEGDEQRGQRIAGVHALADLAVDRFTPGSPFQHGCTAVVDGHLYIAVLPYVAVV